MQEMFFIDRFPLNTGPSMHEIIDCIYTQDFLELFVPMNIGFIV